MTEQKDMLMKILSERQVLLQKDDAWYCRTIQKAKYDTLDIVIEKVERLT